MYKVSISRKGASTYTGQHKYITEALGEIVVQIIQIKINYFYSSELYLVVTA